MNHQIKKLTTIPELMEWQEKLYESEQSAVSGREIPEEEQVQLVKELIDPSYIYKQLEEIRAYKQKLSQDLAWASEREQLLLKEISLREQSLS